ncbi:MAG TPA: cell wall hydrolase [Candidatus Acutalibacter pullistercoris]|uniref:Cell wall hydrolase n=1 Tax=Candidatus Acutalibacter pullistercoris TaxID=2838418 RepID=A0A9D2BZW8_9FIRM|nr:cell wall hydrolase [Candidatus Acutalibacter pullistercoris]
MKRILALLLALGLAVAGAGAAWAGGLSQYVTVRGYDPEVDYMRAMKQALEDGSPYAMEVGALYEQQRNLKIQELELPQEQTAYFSQYGEAEEILEAMAQAEAPKAAYTQADLDLLSRLIYAEAGCTWIPDWVQRMVGSVVLNRVESQYYPDTIREVIYQPGQYAPTWDGSLQKTPDARTIENTRYLLEHGSICPENVVGQNSIITGSGVYTSYYDQVLDTTIYFCYL